MTGATATSGRPEIQAALVLLAGLGLTPADLDVAAAESRPPVPTFTEYVPKVKEAVTPGTLKTYGTYWDRLVETWPGKRLTEPTTLDLISLGKKIRSGRVVRRNGRGGAGAEENYVAAIRCLYKFAVNDGVITQAENAAARVTKPKRTASTRSALPDDRLTDINRVASTTGNDPALDSLLLRLHTETACRRAGALNIRRCDLDVEQCLVLLREKGFTTRWQPVSPSMMSHLLSHWDERGDGNPRSTAPLLRYRTGKPLTYRRYDGLWVRLGKYLPWVAVQCISAHWLRHTILRWVERHFGYAVARKYAGHAEKDTGDVGATIVYTKADIVEVAAALSVLTGEPHPLVSQGHHEPRQGPVS
ncbi:site-specific integrase [Micromonospora sp. NPDC049107]|uniref:site-specific integrase n=1 Tax=unclassified Micromonospora TaxID=2617518 RepID=UPI0033ED81EC